MRYFIEEMHTEKEWIFQRSHTLLLGIIFTAVLFLGAIGAIVLGTVLGKMFLGAMPVLVLLLLVIDFVVAFSVIEWLGKGWTIWKMNMAAVIKKKKIEVSQEGFGSQTVRFSK